jgi:hypothetical protein
MPALAGYRLLQLTIHKTTDRYGIYISLSCLYRSKGHESRAYHASIERVVTARHSRLAVRQAFQRLIPSLSELGTSFIRLLVIFTERLLTRHLHPICQPRALLFRHLQLGHLCPPP